MKIINYISIIAMPLIILLIISNGLKEKIPVFDIFLKGAKEGIEIVLKIFPTLIGLFVAIGMLRSSGVLEFIIKIISPITQSLNIPSEILPLAMLRPISGSASMAVVIMGSTETTLYTIAVYSESIKVKKTRFILMAALAADLIGIIVSVIVCKSFFT